MRDKTMKQELYEDVMKEETEDTYTDPKAIKKFNKRLYNSIGWVDPVQQGRVFFKKTKDNKDKITSDILDKEFVWDVKVENGGVLTCKTQEHAEIVSYLAKMNFRQIRIEEKLDKLLSQSK